MIKLVLLDVDGTITDNERRISTKAIESMRMVQSEYLRVSLVSGNALPVMFGLKTFIGLNAPVFGEAGGAMLDLEVKAFFPIEKISKLCRKLESEKLITGNVTNAWRYCSAGFSMPKGNVSAVRKRTEESGLELVDSKIFWDFVNPGQNKGFAMEVLKEMYNLKYSEILVMGDSFNDLSMFKDGVFKAVPANAEAELQELADYCSPHSYGDAVSDVLSDLDRF